MKFKTYAKLIFLLISFSAVAQPTQNTCNRRLEIIKELSRSHDEGDKVSFFRETLMPIDLIKSTNTFQDDIALHEAIDELDNNPEIQGSLYFEYKKSQCELETKGEARKPLSREVIARISRSHGQNNNAKNNASKTNTETSPVNALWNDSGNKREIGFWLYKKNGKCPSLRNSAFIAVAPKDKKEGDEAESAGTEELSYCFNNEGGRCKSGFFSYKYLSETKMYSGSYKFTLTTGDTLEGTFLAEYCPPSK